MHFIRKDKDLTTADISKSGEVTQDKVSETDNNVAADTSGLRGGGPQLVGGQPKRTGATANVPLLPEGEMRDLQARWDKIQAAFVDEPEQAVQDADNLVAIAIKRLAEQFAEERSRVEKEWSGGEISTESLRQALRKYRAFFQRLLSV